MDQFMKAILRMVNLMGKDFLSTTTNVDTMEIGLMISSMGMEKRLGLMVQSTRECTRMV